MIVVISKTIHVCNNGQARAHTVLPTTTTRFGWLNARKKHNLPYIETIHIQLDQARTFYHRGVENAQVISQKKDAKPVPIHSSTVYREVVHNKA